MDPSPEYTPPTANLQHAQVSKQIIICLISLFIFASLKTFFWFLVNIVAGEDIIILDVTLVAISGLILFVIGWGAGVLAKAWKQISLSDSDEGMIFFGVFLLFIASNFCFSGGCIPGSFLSTIITIPCLLPVLLGFKFSSFTRW